ncbi:phage integrase family protein [Pseudoduganella flava]|uniref:Phage integrase family protein n=1 Tax=Pseudoduganella flava TaxID=871742 RepID=A0A562PTJ8_9BURK|nr:site-specific integrase [Pseudoduganella flava]TWI47718.1 phage integrase family protein [Pseudoduganella flava]
MRLLIGLGLREREAAGARQEWIDWQRSTYTLGRTKRRGAEPVPVPRWMIDHLRLLSRDEGLIAPRADGTELQAGFSRRPMMLANALCKTNGVTPHRLRGTFATLFSEEGVPIQTIQKVMRHKSPLTTMPTSKRPGHGRTLRG